MLQLEEEKTSPTTIKVVGVGGGGMNAVNRMMDAELQGVDFIVINTDEQALKKSSVNEKIAIGQKTSRGRGAGGDPEIGMLAAMEDRDRIYEIIKGADMVFVTAGMGGGTGTGAAPVVAEVAREMGALTVGVVTVPFSWEGGRRAEYAAQGLAALKDKVDTLITIRNDSIFHLIDRNTSVHVAFRMIDDILLNAVRGISDLINQAGVINVDFADVRAVMGDTGDALMGSGEGVGDDRIESAVNQAIHNVLLEDMSIEGATSLLINICGEESMPLNVMREISESIGKQVDPQANIIIGLTLDPAMQDRIRVTVIATGFDPERRSRAHGQVAQVGGREAAQSQATSARRSLEELSRAVGSDPHIGSAVTSRHANAPLYAPQPPAAQAGERRDDSSARLREALSRDPAFADDLEELDGSGSAAGHSAAERSERLERIERPQRPSQRHSLPAKPPAARRISSDPFDMEELEVPAYLRKSRSQQR